MPRNKVKSEAEGRERLAKFLQRTFAEKGLTSEDVADRASSEFEVDHTTVWRYLNGRISRVQVYILEAIAFGGGIAFQELIDIYRGGRANVERIENDKFQVLHDDYKTLPDESKPKYDWAFEVFQKEMRRENTPDSDSAAARLERIKPAKPVKK